MAIYRQLQISFWQDDFVGELTPEEKYFYIYLMTNSMTTQCGIYKFNRKLAEYETGHNRETIEKLLERFVGYGRILLSEDTKELMILNWVKYNFINSRNTILCMNKELKEVKDSSFIEKLYELCLERQLPVDAIFSGIELPLLQKQEGALNPSEGACEGLGEEEIKEEIKIKEVNAAEVAEVFSSNIHPITPMEKAQLCEWLHEVESGVVLLAIEEAVNHKAKSMAYINKVLSSWCEQSIKSTEKAAAYVKNNRLKRGKDELKKPPVNNKEPLVRTNAAAYKVLGGDENE